jgi:hypothetical protein
MRWPDYITKSVLVGILLTVTTATIVIFLIFVAGFMYLKLTLASVIAFQLSFIWTCAELLDGTGDKRSDDQSVDGNFSH